MGRMTLEHQIAHFEIQHNNLIKEIMKVSKPSIKKKMEETAFFFRDIIASLRELKTIKDDQALIQKQVDDQKVIPVDQTEQH